MHHIINIRENFMQKIRLLQLGKLIKFLSYNSHFTKLIHMQMAQKTSNYGNTAKKAIFNFENVT